MRMELYLLLLQHRHSSSFLMLPRTLPSLDALRGDFAELANDWKTKHAENGPQSSAVDSRLKEWVQQRDAEAAEQPSLPKDDLRSQLEDGIWGEFETQMRTALREDGTATEQMEAEGGMGKDVVAEDKAEAQSSSLGGTVHHIRKFLWQALLVIEPLAVTLEDAPPLLPSIKHLLHRLGTFLLDMLRHPRVTAFIRSILTFFTVSAKPLFTAHKIQHELLHTMLQPDEATNKDTQAFLEAMSLTETISSAVPLSSRDVLATPMRFPILPAWLGSTSTSTRSLQKKITYDALMELVTRSLDFFWTSIAPLVTSFAKLALAVLAPYLSLVVHALSPLVELVGQLVTFVFRHALHTYFQRWVVDVIASTRSSASLESWWAYLNVADVMKGGGGGGGGGFENPPTPPNQGDL